jgi:hypothetical protein
MACSVKPLAVSAALVFLLSGCGVFQRPERPAWRAQAENVCLARHLVQASAYAQPAKSIDGPGICGLEHPFKVAALDGGTVALNAVQTIGCPLTAALDQWVHDVVQPIAMARFGQPVVQVNSMGSFSCRSIDNLRGAKLSEHAFGNAIDIGGFKLADGRAIVVVKAWTRGDEQEKAFLREAQAGACNIFTTVLAPGSDTFHYNHIHLDLAMHGQTSTGPRRICKPRPSPQLVPAPGPRDGLPDSPEIEEELDVSSRGGATTLAGGLSAATPPAVQRQPMRQAYVPGAPMQLGQQPAAMQPRGAPTRGVIDENGVFVPDEKTEGAETTSSIGRRAR